ncbi:LacI family DNA-binding transcriptional regulator [Flavobacterium gilvum]|uniref:LacI family transcriptional regulator n=1 Tax=Flavobacterium gilvum TaxID=1492737 RepID=A0AAC9I5C1_9FLAO|nr:LacI family DNA-binding transcriptional regulator [Flavobacterium gilvum]AOW11169.1 LacI family transcriptional regulator [Flavobacterium gilvum]KFC60057.1 LacI-family transcriptional regulator [Flavobacterium gilvum]
MQKKHTIRDIAEMAGVSTGTVDRVIHKRGYVSQVAFEKVNKLLDEINYQPNLIARNLRNNKVYRICVLIPDPKKDVYWSPCIDGIDKVISEMETFGIDIEMSFFDPENSKSFSAGNLAIQDTIPDAVILVPLFPKEALIAIENYNVLGIMVSTFNNRMDSSLLKNFVGQDLNQSGRVAARLLESILNKDGDIAVIHLGQKDKNDVQIQEKENGFRYYFKESTHFKNNIITCKLKQLDFENELSVFLKNHKNLAGVFITTSNAYQVVEVIQSIIDRKIVVIGYDLLEENVKYLKNKAIDFLIHQNLKQQAYLCVNTIAEYLLFEKNIPVETFLPIDIINSENVNIYLSV